jgi:mono/diheme cytochrome c family protein/glucose/arabinose dehydrogenase
VASYRSLEPGADRPSLVRIDAKPTFTWGRSSPHPRIAPGPFEVVWVGVLILQEKDSIRWSAYLGGEVTVTIDGTVVLRGRSETEEAQVETTATFSRRPGTYKVRIKYRSLPGVPARLQLWWEGKTFSREAVPAWRLKHGEADLPPSASHEDTWSRGRIAAGRLGCARCHPQAFPGVSAPPPGPDLSDLGQRVQRPWLLDWLAEPSRLRPNARMPVLFTPDRTGLVERWIVSAYLLEASRHEKPTPAESSGDLRAGRQAFIGLGCAACHTVPDDKPASASDPDRYAFQGLANRFTPHDLTAFLMKPSLRYPDGRMPQLPIPADTARHLAAYLLKWSKPAAGGMQPEEVVRPQEIDAVARRLGVTGLAATGLALIREKGCARCHTGLGEMPAQAVVIRRPAEAARDGHGCLVGTTLPRFHFDAETRRVLAAYLEIAAQEKHPSPFETRQQRLRDAGCLRCHQRDDDRAAPLEAIGRTLWTPFLYRLPYQRTPRLTNALSKYTREYLLASVRDGVTGVRPDWYSYRMPHYGRQAEELVQALAEGDGDLPKQPDRQNAPVDDPTLPTLGPVLVGFEGYSCVSCHVWKGQALAEVEPGTVGPELTTVTQRVRRDWFNRFVENPLRAHPSTPMPAIFRKGEPATLQTVLAGDADRQRDAIWAYLAQGSRAESPKPRPPTPIAAPGAGMPPLVAQIPIQLPDLSVVESICVLYGTHDLLLYDVGTLSLRNVYTGAQILRRAHVWRGYLLTGTPAGAATTAAGAQVLITPRGRENATTRTLHGYDRLADGVRIRSRLHFPSGLVEMVETLRLPQEGLGRRFLHDIQLQAVPVGCSLELQTKGYGRTETTATAGQVHASESAGVLSMRFLAESATRIAQAALRHDLPAAQSPPVPPRPIHSVPQTPTDDGLSGGALERPGYRAILYPRPKTVSGEDRIMPGALATDPRSGRLFIASMKLGELFVLRDPHDNGTDARYDDYAHGLFQEAYGLLHDGDALYVLHRRNLTRICETHGDGRADRFDRVAALPHEVANVYDWGYGLARDRAGAFILSFAPYGKRHPLGSGSVLRLMPGPEAKLEEVAFGLRNPFGWCSGPEGEVFFTDNQGEWIATNKLCHVDACRFYGYPHPHQRPHHHLPGGKTAVWIPYDWARSINGVAYDTSDGRFGPFAGQFFLAELMNGGAIIRANVEKIKGVYQGACFPFWGKGLLGPLVLTFDPRGRLFVGGITQPGWMGQPDRGALFRIDYTGKVPFEIQSIQVLPHGFRLRFTTPVDPATARALASYQVEHYRYEYTGAYGSPELDRTRLDIQGVSLQADGRTVDLTTAALVKGRVYALSARGVRSAGAEALVYPTGVYTLNEIPDP